MNRNMRLRRGRNRRHNLLIGGGAVVVFVLMIGYGLWTGPSDEKTNKGKEAVMEITITKDNFKAEVLDSNRPVLVDFWAPWCGPCRMMAPVLAELAAEKSDTIKVGKVNVDDEPELAARYGISGIPALLLFKAGQVAGSSVGFRPKPDLETFIAAHLTE